jgi:hypothetical protein
VQPEGGTTLALLITPFLIVLSIVNPDSNPERWLRRTQRFFVKKSSLIAASTAITAGIFAATLTYLQPDSAKTSASVITTADKAADKLPLETKNIRWGFFMDEYSLSEKELQRGDILGAILMEQAGPQLPTGEQIGG